MVAQTEEVKQEEKEKEVRSVLFSRTWDFWRVLTSVQEGEKK